MAAREEALPRAEASTTPAAAPSLSAFRYVPVLRLRQEENFALRAVLPSLSDKILPLLEIVVEKPNARGRARYTDILRSIQRPVMVDFPIYMQTPSSANRQFLRFLLPLKQNPSGRLALFQQLKGVPGLVPVVSYNYRSQQLAPQEIAALAPPLQSDFPVMAFRLFPSHWMQALQVIASLLRVGDILVFDIDEAPVQSTALQNAYAQVTRVAQQRRARSCLLRSAIPSSGRNYALPHGQPYPDADDSLKLVYRSLGFDAFGDYAGIKRDEAITEGGEVSLGFLFYSWHNNHYLALRGIRRDIRSFGTVIAPAIVASAEWSQYSAHHRSTCPGCALIDSIATAKRPPGTQGLWKRIAVMHYLYTMEELLP